MFHTIKRYVSLFIIVGLLSAVPVLARTNNAEKNRKSDNYVIDLQGKKNVALTGKFLSIKGVHTYRMNVKQGETVILTVNSAKPSSMKVQSPSGAVTLSKGEKSHRAVLSGNGEFIVEINSDDISYYSIDVASR